MNRRALLLCAVLPAGLVGCETGGDASTSAKVERIVLIVVDTLRKDHLSCYGYQRETSPAIDRLAREGIRYENSISQAPWTTPSLGALFTSRYPSELGIEDERSVLDDSLLLLPEVLQQSGFTTAAVVSHDFCSSEWGFARGFDSFDEENVLGHAGISSPGVTSKALEFIEAHADERFFLWLHYFDPHSHYYFHDGFTFDRDEPYDGKVTEETPPHILRRRIDTLNKGDLDELRRIYDTEIRWTDHHIGQVLERLRELGLYEGALIAFTADHGEEFLDHGNLGHARNLFQELVNVPLIVKHPGGAHAGTVIEEAVATVDLYPSILALCGIEASASLVGTLLPRNQAQARSLSERMIFSETSRKGKLRALVSGHRKLIKNLETERYELYDFQADTEEANPKLRGKELKAMRAVLDAWIERMEREGREATERELTPEELAELQALGYGGEEDEE